MSSSDERRRPTMKDVAALAGVSLKTVSRVINEEPRVSPQVISRVMVAVKQLNFQPDQRAGSLRRAGRKSQTIGLIVSNVANPFAAAINRAVENAARDRGIAVFASSIDDDPDRERLAAEALLRRRVDGLIITPARSSQSYLLTEQRFGTPMVFVDREPVGVDADVVVSDHAQGASTAARHLLDVGHRRIAYLGDLSTIQSAQERKRGFLEELGRRGVSTLDCPVVMDLHEESAAERVALELLTSDAPPTAIFSSQNLITVGVLRALRSIDAHRSVAVVGFDDLPLADLLVPGLTVVAQDPKTIGTIAANLLFQRLDGDDEGARRRVVETVLIPRGTGEIPPVNQA